MASGRGSRLACLARDSAEARMRMKSPWVRQSSHGGGCCSVPIRLIEGLAAALTLSPPSNRRPCAPRRVTRRAVAGARIRPWRALRGD